MNTSSWAADILIVDDDIGVLRALDKAVRPPHNVRFATSGAEALRLMEDDPPDLVLLDNQMPGMSGFELLGMIKRDPVLADVPVIIVTTQSDPAFELNGLEQGAADFIAKPVQTAIVRARVQTQVNLKRANDTLKQISEVDRLNLAQAMVDLRASHAQLQQTAEALKLANEGLLQFVRISSHDLLEPLNTVVQFAGLMEEDHGTELPDGAQRYLRLMRNAGERMRSLLDDVVRYSRLQRGESDPPKPVQLDLLLANLCDALAAPLIETGTQLSIHPLPTVMGHASLLSLLFQNLLSNAMKFVPEGRAPKINVSSRLSNGLVTIRVQDNGIGIAPHHIEKLFQPFARLNLRREFEGSGLGLALCRQIVEAHGGTLTVQSVLGAGSSFEVHLPQYRDDRS
ncbi:hybrid sensor histidine kinase/response regulator [Hydrogenophaga sp. NH-16]|uniref:sensor histidine kinase n=1 Tax=Hydrogenophaga sp. NH-16 TaxID=2184519 RepID=UPI000FD9F952|nr:hybrid sensor histidine kinase/response regulator [Hydrogenophaga sp. NH-16]